MANSIIFKGSSGLNNKINAFRLSYNSDTGIGYLAECINCDIDDSGMISRRFGQIEKDSSNQVWCKGGDGFAVKHVDGSASLYITTDGEVFTPIWAGFTFGARFSFEQVGGRTYFMNGFESGYVEDGIVNPWPSSNHVGSVTTRDFTNAPIGTKFAYHKSRMWIVDGKIVWVTEPGAFGKINKLKGHYQFGTDVLMIKPVKNGVWISDSEETSFISTAERWVDNEFINKLPYPAHEWSENIELVDLIKTQFQIPGLSAIWSCNAGLVIGADDGQFNIVSEGILDYPPGGSGASVVDGHNVINSVY